MKIAIVGPYPPPYGGISVHIQRLERLLEKDGHEVVVFRNSNARKWLAEARAKWFSYDVVHFHDGLWKNRLLIGLIGVIGHNVVLTIHGDSLKNQVESGGWLRRSLLRVLLGRITHLVGVKTAIRDLLLTIGVKTTHVSVINAYLPPVLEQEGPIPENLRAFVETHTPMLVGNGFQVVPLSEQGDLYGIEMTIELCVRLVSEFPKLGCLFFLGQIGDQNRYDKLVARVAYLGLSEHFRFVIGESLIPTLKCAALFVRPTFEDGYGSSVAEAVSLKIPALASDVCERAEGALTFSSGNSDEFYHRARHILYNHEEAVHALENIKPTSSYTDLLKVYRCIADRGTVRGSRKQRERRCKNNQLH